MANKYLARDDAPFASAVWERLDTTMQDVARSQLVGRRILDTEGPYGLGLKAVPLADGETESGLIASQVLPVFFVHKPFTLGTRDIANYEQDGLALDSGPVVEATLECARLEDELVFHGAPRVPGLLAAEGSNRMDLSSWEEWRRTRSFKRLPFSTMPASTAPTPWPWPPNGTTCCSGSTRGASRPSWST
jgi:uncharacterized linocin/CFP29 family protein